MEYRKCDRYLAAVRLEHTTVLVNFETGSAGFPPRARKAGLI
jgi:hypothetical protein